MMERKRAMKNIFKKLHIGTNHDPNRSSNDSSSSSSAHSLADSSPSDPPQQQQQQQISSPTPSSLNRQQQQDYFFSEEEYQVQLALALSVSADSRPGPATQPYPDSDRIRTATLLSLDHQRTQLRDAAAPDLLSRQYWDYGLLDYEEKVVDGFYDVYGVSADPSNQGKMPSLSDLETNPGSSGFEVIIVNKTIDPALQELLQIAQCIALDCPPSEVSLLVQRLAELVTQHMGGPVQDANIILAKWMERSTELRTSLHTSVLPIGSIRVGLSRHRALLFKVLAENAGITCRLVKGSHYTGVEDDAVNIIKLANESEFLVDLMAAPGTLIPVDIFSGKDSSLKPHNPISSKFLSLQKSNESEVINSKPLQTDDREGRGQDFAAQNSLPSGRKSSSENKGFLPAGSNASFDFKDTSLKSHNQLDHIPSLAIGSSLYKGGRGPNAVGDGLRMNVNVVPYSENSTEDTKNLFADLNPFQIKGSSKALLQNNTPKNKADEIQRSKNNLISGRPPVPLMWKNRHALNEVPKKKERDIVEGLFLKNSLGANDVNSSSLASTSGATSGKIYPDSFMSHDNLSLVPTENSERDVLTGGNAGSAMSEWKTYRLSLDVESKLSDNAPQTNRTDLENDRDETNIFHDGKRHSQEMTSITNLNFKDSENSRSSVGSSVSQIDPVIDDVNDCEIPWEDLLIGERIGLGSYGEVYHADWNGTEVAVKKFLDQDFSGAALAEFRREVRIMQRLRHPNIVLFMGAVTRPPNLSIITEFLPRGSLYRIIHRPQCQIDEKRRIKMALDVAKGMNCLHTSIPTVVHRDLKSPNLLVDKNWNVKVSDFGLSRLKHNTFLSSKSTAGTPEWMAPEVLRNENSNEKCDVYSFGVILWELATLRMPWSGMNPMQVVGAVGFQNRRLEIPKDLDPLVARIIWECWQKNWKTVLATLRMPWSGMNPMQVVGAVGFQNRRLEIPKDLDPLVARIIWECWQNDPNLRPSFAQLTVALKPLQRLGISSQVDHPSLPLQPAELSVDSTF